MLELQTAPDPLTATPMGNENRKHARHLCLDGGVLKLAVRPEFRGRRALLIDVSAGGIGFVLADELPIGSVMVFEVQRPPSMDTIGRIAKVRHCRPHATPPDAPWLEKPSTYKHLFRRLLGMKKPEPQGHAWLIGCEFTQPLSEDEVKAFLDCIKPAPF